jgi:hypothetical protein
MARAIYKFEVNCGRNGDLIGVFSCEKDELNDKIGKQVDFYEILGKHSNISIILDWAHLTEVTTDKKFIELFDLYDLSTGVNPLDYFED